MQIAAPASSPISSKSISPCCSNPWAATGSARHFSRPEVQYARARARMLMTLDGDHGRASAASSHARRTAGGGTEKSQNLSSPTAMRSAPSASPSSKTHIMAALTLARSARDGIGPQRLELGVPGRLETFHKLKEVREVPCSESGGRLLGDAMRSDGRVRGPGSATHPAHPAAAG